MRIIENNAPVKREKCWNCNSILELNLTDYDTIDYDTDENYENYDGDFSFLPCYLFHLSLLSQEKLLRCYY